MSGFYSIPIGGLKEGKQEYDFDLGAEFFEQFEEPEITGGSLKAHVESDKRSTHADLTIRIFGTVKVPCDRCLEMMEFPVSCENKLLVKFGKVHDDVDPDIITTAADENELDLAQYFYEYILLALPIQRIHPDDEHGNSTCDPRMLKKLKEHVLDEEDYSDPRWDELKKLMNNN